MIRPPASLSGPPAGDLCHVTVQAPRRRVDLALPATTPILEFTPILATLCQAGVDPRLEATPPAWTLGRAAGAPFDVTATLAGEGVLDGEVLHLVDAAVWRGPTVADLAEAVTEVLEAGARWTGEATSWLFAGLAVASLLAAAVVATGVGAVDRGSGAAILVIAAALAAAALFVPAIARRRQAQVAVAGGAVVLAGLAGWGLVGAGAGVVGAGLGLTAALLVLTPVLPAIGPGGALTVGVLTMAAAAEAAGVTPAHAAAVVVVGGVIGLRLWPALVSGGLSAFAGEPDAAEAAEAARRSRRLLASLSGATALVLLAAVLALLAAGGPFAAGLAAAAGVALALRAQAYRFLPDALPPALAAAAVLVVLELAVAIALARQGLALLAVVLPAATGLGLAGLAAVRVRLTPPVPGTRLAWLAVDVALAPLALGTLGVFGLITELVHRLVA